MKEINSLIISFYGISIHSLKKSDDNPTPNSHFFLTQKSVELYSAHYGNSNCGEGVVRTQFLTCRGSVNGHLLPTRIYCKKLWMDK